MAVFNKDKPDNYLEDPKTKGDFDSLRYYNREGGEQFQSGYGSSGYGVPSALQMQQRQQQLASQQQQMQSMSRGQNDYSMLNMGGVKPQNTAIYGASPGSNSGMFPQGRSPVMPTNYGGIMYGNPNENFTIEKEDFPALPGSQKHGDSGASTVSGLHTVTGRDLGLVGGGAAGAAGSIGSTQHTQQSATASTTTPNSNNNDYSGGVFSSPVFERSNGINITGILSAGNTASASGGSGSTAATTSTTSVPGGSVELRYGLGGLLDIMRMADKDINSLTLGTDLTSFGLNLNATDSLFPTFASPFTEKTLTPDPQYRTPSCYLMHPPSLKSEHLLKFQLETLFYMFYSMPKDILQTYAAMELYHRDWRYHNELKIWLKPRSSSELMQSHPSVMFVFFDVSGWETRLFTSTRGSNTNIVQSLLTEDEIRIKLHNNTTTSASSGSSTTGSNSNMMNHQHISS